MVIWEVTQNSCINAAEILGRDRKGRGCYKATLRGSYTKRHSGLMVRPPLRRDLLISGREWVIWVQLPAEPLFFLLLSPTSSLLLPLSRHKEPESNLIQTLSKSSTCPSLVACPWNRALPPTLFTVLLLNFSTRTL